MDSKRTRERYKAVDIKFGEIETNGKTRKIEKGKVALYW